MPRATTEFKIIWTSSDLEDMEHMDFVVEYICRDCARPWFDDDFYSDPCPNCGSLNTQTGHGSTQR